MTGAFYTAPWFTNGANLWQWVTSVVTVVGWSAAAWAYWHHRCAYCVRPGQVPIAGTEHKSCKHHAKQKGHIHP